MKLEPEVERVGRSSQPSAWIGNMASFAGIIGKRANVPSSTLIWHGSAHARLVLSTANTTEWTK
jgi:hypothetical protein